MKQRRADEAHAEAQRRRSVRCAVAVCVIALWAGCSGPYPGYKEVGEETYFKLMAFGESEVKAHDSDSVLMRIRVARLNEPPGSLFSTEQWYGVSDSTNGFVHQVIRRLNEQDSASVIARGRRVPWSRLGANDMGRYDTSMVYLELSLIDVRSPEESRALAAERVWNSRTAAIEEAELNAFLDTSGKVYQEFMGVRYLPEKDLPSKDPIQSGEVVTIHYIASFLKDGHVFDDTHKGGQPLTFRLGDPGQVIEGLEVAMHVLGREGHGTFIIPSSLAFGEQGSAGIVPPYTAVVYQIEVVNVQQVPDHLP